ncbi:MAG: DUF1559 domain-containing protein [Gemmataceae bacterium]|nr:DUF1559 domain-containing protein [Gemmataceae bacterium]
MRIPSHRSGFTLVELLVLIAIVAILTALLVPAIQRVRESAARTQCTNNLKEIGLAFHSFHDIHKLLPQGGWTPPGACAADVNDRRQFGWSFQILPFLQQRDIYENPRSNAIAAAVAPVYYCPSRRQPGLYRGHNVIDYAGCAGSTRDGRDGVVTRGYVPSLSMSEIGDGVSNTLMVAEKQCNVARFGASADDNQSPFLSGWNGHWDHYRRVWKLKGVWQTPRPDYGSPSLMASQRFGSSHSAGINALFVDGCVRTIGYDIDPIPFMRACVRDDGLPFNAHDL